MILVDSSVWIDYFNGNPTPESDYLDSILGHQSILVGDLILAEVLQGFKNDSDFESAHLALLSFPCVEIVNKYYAIESARNYRILRKMGISVRKTIDCLIATFCLENDISLLHSDHDFVPFETHIGLNVIHPV